MYPAGRAGIALLCLRGTVVAAIALLWALDPNAVGSRLLAVAAALLIFLVLIGLMTRAAVGITCALCAARLLVSGGVVSLCEVIAVLASVSLLLLGPGALSLDAMLFGRRRVTFDSNDT